VTLSDTRAELYQWFSLFGGGLAWATQLVLLFGVGTARCSTGGSQWGVDQRTWVIVVTAAAGLIVLLAEAAAAAVALETWGVAEDGPPPDARRHFFAVAAVVGNVLFLGAVILGGAGALAHPPCQGA
jgi:hypothetical protein